jgi:hypothetical protein
VQGEAVKTNGPGKYDWLASRVRTETDAALVAVIVMGGSLGEGFAVQAIDPELVRQLPDMLEGMARRIRAENELS